jgi:hypothetical protein
VAAEDEAARCVLVETVRGLRAAGQAEAQGVEMMKQGLAALGAGMHRQTGRFVDHEHQGIAIQQSAYYLFRIHDASAIEAATLNQA